MSDEMQAVNAEADRLMTADDLAERWRVKPSQVYRLTREGRIPAVKLGRYYRYRLGAIEAYERESESDRLPIYAR